MRALKLILIVGAVLALVACAGTPKEGRPGGKMEIENNYGIVLHNESSGQSQSISGGAPGGACTDGGINIVRIPNPPESEQPFTTKFVPCGSPVPPNGEVLGTFGGGGPSYVTDGGVNQIEGDVDLSPGVF